MNISKKEFFESKEKALEFVKANLVGAGDAKVNLRKGSVPDDYIFTVRVPDSFDTSAGFFAPTTMQLRGQPGATWRLTDNFWETIYPKQFNFIKETQISNKHKLIYANIFSREQYITTIEEQFAKGNTELENVRISPDSNLDNWIKRSITLYCYLSYFGFNIINSIEGGFNVNTDKINELINIK